MENERLDNARVALNQYIKHYENKVKRAQGNLAGNTSVDMRNMGVAILDTLLRVSSINRSQYDNISKKYFKI